jgi:hypothetical protein
MHLVCLAVVTLSCAGATKAARYSAGYCQNTRKCSCTHRCTLRCANTAACHGLGDVLGCFILFVGGWLDSKCSCPAVPILYHTCPTQLVESTVRMRCAWANDMQALILHVAFHRNPLKSRSNGWSRLSSAVCTAALFVGGVQLLGVAGQDIHRSVCTAEWGGLC